MGRILTCAIISLFSFSVFAADKTCGPQTVSWPAGVNKSCGDQINGNGLAPIGTQLVVIDPLNSGEATYRCTEQGWEYNSGYCSIGHNYQCISEEMQRHNGSVFYEMTKDEIDENLNSLWPSDKLVEFTNLCDKK